MKKGQKRPYYGNRTKKEIIRTYFASSASMDELTEIYGILGSNTVASWLKKNGNLRPRNFSNIEVMNKPHSPTDEKEYRKKRYKSDEQLRLGELEFDLDTTQQRVHFYQYSLSIINDLAKELTG